YAFVSYVAMIAATALRAKRLTRQVFFNRLSASVISIPIGWLMILAWGIHGAVLGMIVTYGALCVFYWVTYRRAFRTTVTNHAESSDARLSNSCVSRKSQNQVARILGQFANGSDADWDIRPLGTGGEASVFSVQRIDGMPVWQSFSELAVKVFAQNSNPEERMVQNEFDSLQRLHDGLDGKEFDGWLFQSPRPLIASDEHAALVMTPVHGTRLQYLLLHVNQETSELLETIASPLIKALQPLWHENDWLHGDLNFENLLCDLPNKRISLVDPGTANEFWHCQNIGTGSCSASRDLAYMIFDVCTSTVRNSVVGRHRGFRLVRLVEQMLCFYLGQLDAASDRESQIDEIHDCVQLHFKHYRACGSRFDPWRHFVGQVASRRINRILERAKVELCSADRVLSPVDLSLCCPDGQGGSQ
ncbi:MAG: hypothetical protein IH991_21540, partial [Planctomycetes bacterium]|nr:hypothetical protein [Planctomycetota bacterium]